MDPLYVFAFAVFAFMALAVVGVIVFAVIRLRPVAERQGAKLRAANERFAAMRGWAYRHQDDAVAGLGATAPFRPGTGATAFHVATLAIGSAWSAMFTLRSFTQTMNANGASVPSPHTDAVLMVAITGNAPVVRLVHRASPSMAAVLGLTDVPMESAQFNAAWVVQSADERAAHAVLAPHVMESLMSPELAGWTVVLEPGRMFATRPDYVDFAAHEPALYALARVAAAIPPSALQD